MGLTQKLGTIPLAIFTDASNNVGIGASPSGSFKFEVTGTGRFTGALTGLSATFNGGTNAVDVLGSIRTDGASNGINLRNGFTATITNPNNNTRDIRFDQDVTGTVMFKANGNVGIGTSSPLALLDVCVLSSGARRLLVNYADSIVTVKSSNDSSNGENLRLVGDNIFFNSGSSGNGSERMRITNGGDILVNNGNIRALGGGIVLRDSANTATGGLFIKRMNWLGSGSDLSPTIAAETGYGIYTYTNGNASPSGPYVAVGGTTWTNGSSDVRKKKNFETSQGLSEILQIEPIKYHFNQDDDSSKKRLGFKAQNILELIPEMVLETGEIAEDGTPYLTITPDYILPVLVKAIQEQQDLIQELSSKVSALENKS
jgi:hypothetical protein